MDPGKGKWPMLLLFMICVVKVKSQNATPPEGSYYLEGVMETASGFKFNADHTFDFFFSYGALDRTGKGNWRQSGDSIFLDSDEKQRNGFRMVKSTTTSENKLIIKIKNENKVLIRNIVCLVVSDRDTMGDYTDGNGMVELLKKPFRKILLVHDFFPEKLSEFIVDNPRLNYFEFEIDKSIADVSFNHLMFKMNDNGLVGEHPILERKKYRYYRQ